MTMMKAAAQRLCLPPFRENGAVLRQAVHAALAALGASREEAADMVLAVSEAFNNAVCHGSMDSDDWLGVEIEAMGTELVVALDYRGLPFLPEPATLPEAMSTHGRGRYLMERLTDRTSYLFQDGWTYLELRKRIQGV